MLTPIEVTPETLKAMNLRQIAQVIRSNWPKVSPYAKPYLDALSTMDKITDKYICDDGIEIVLYFLSNATGWRGEAARMVKVELNRRVQLIQKG